jgi:hypothetical protein
LITVLLILISHIHPLLPFSQLICLTALLTLRSEKFLPLKAIQTNLRVHLCLRPPERATVPAPGEQQTHPRFSQVSNENTILSVVLRSYSPRLIIARREQDGLQLLHHRIL